MSKKITFNINGITEEDRIASSVTTMLDYFDTLSIKRTDLGIVFGDNNTEIMLPNGNMSTLGDNGYFYLIGKYKDTQELYNVAYVNYSGGNKMFALTNLAIALGDILSHEHFEKWYNKCLSEEASDKKLNNIVALRGAYAYALAIVLINSTNPNKALTLLQRVDISRQFPFIDLPLMLNNIDIDVISQNMLDLAVADRLFNAGVMANWNLGTLLDKEGNPVEIKEDEDKLGKVPYYDNSIVYLGKVCEFINYMIEGYIKDKNLDFVVDDKVEDAIKAVTDFNDMLIMIRDEFKKFMELEEQKNKDTE